nr:unnamed protein product [Digitaria exilis]
MASNTPPPPTASALNPLHAHHMHVAVSSYIAALAHVCICTLFTWNLKPRSLVVLRRLPLLLGHARHGVHSLPQQVLDVPKPADAVTQSRPCSLGAHVRQVPCGAIAVVAAGAPPGVTVSIAHHRRVWLDLTTAAYGASVASRGDRYRPPRTTTLNPMDHPHLCFEV